MSLGQVISMKYWRWNTPNHGVVLDFTTGIEYPFHRPDITLGTVPKAWNVKVNDIISYTIVNGVATEATLYKKHCNDTVYYKPV
jgi:hypothetical protein